MKDDNFDYNPDELNNDTLSTDPFDPEDRFTTQDIEEIDQILNGFSINEDEELSDIDDTAKNSYHSYLESKKIAQEQLKKEQSSEENKVKVIKSKSEPLESKSESKKTISETPLEEPFISGKEVKAEEIPENNINKNIVPDEVNLNESIQSEPIKKETSKPKLRKTKINKPKQKRMSNKPRNQKGLPKKSQSRKGLPRRRKKSNWKRMASVFVGVFLVLALIAGGGIFLLYSANFTDISGTKYTPKEKTEVYTADNVQIASIYSVNRNYVPIEQVPQDLKNALIATEDSRFYSHNGVDYFGIVRALISNILSRSSTGQGASTITQQLARLLYLPDISTESTFLDSLNRKFKEISISYQMEDKYTKDQILEMYLNEYYFGSAAYGIQSAAQTYFGKNVNELNLAEAAMLAGLPQAPSSYAPNVNFEAAKQRQAEVLDRMVANNYITQQQADEAKNTPITIVPWSENDINNQITPGYQDFVGKVIDEYAQAAAPTIMKERGLSQEEAEDYARTNVASGGYKFYTTLNSTAQQDAISTMEGMLAGYGYDQEYGDTGSLVSVNRSGAVLAYYGGSEAYSDIDMADSPRQPGSNIKPLYYCLALENGTFNTNSILSDSPINIAGYSPHNTDNSYMGNITFSTSLIQSRNVTSVQIFNALGAQTAVDWIKQFGFDTITEDDYNLATATGGLTYGIKPYQMAAAFNTFNNNGVYNQAYFIDHVTTSAGEPVINKDQLGLISTQLISPGTASTMWGLLRGVVTSGTGTSASTSIQTAGKTGTTDNYENLWFTGMTGDITSSIWLGNLDYHVIGGTSAIPAAIYGNYTQTLINDNLVTS